MICIQHDKLWIKTSALVPFPVFEKKCTVVLTCTSCNVPSNISVLDEYTLEKTEEAIKNGQSRDNDNIGYTRHRTKTENKTKYKQQQKKKKKIQPNQKILNNDKIK